MRIDEAIENARKNLEQASESPRLDVEVLLARALDLPRSYLLAHPEELLDEASAARFFHAVEQRRQGMPLSYITGEKEFWSLSLAVAPGVLVPRPETELLVELALREIPRNGECSVLDLGTGSGAIAIALASERPACRFVASDVNPGALAVARHNAMKHGLANIEFVEGNWTAPVADERFNLIVSNPPYVRARDPALADLRFEPEEALVAGDDGLDAIRTLARDCRRLLKEGGLLLLEHGAEQQAEVACILAGEGWARIHNFRDLSGLPRVTRAVGGEQHANC
jgi:release factor glutamine methyltransferase